MSPFTTLLKLFKKLYTHLIGLVRNVRCRAHCRDEISSLCIWPLLVSERVVQAAARGSGYKLKTRVNGPRLKTTLTVQISEVEKKYITEVYCIQDITYKIANKNYIIRQAVSLIPNSSNSSWAISFSFCFSFSFDSTGNQSRIKLISAQSTFAVHKNHQTWNVHLKS